MGKKYLFSPIGNTDPIKYFRDGSMLHISRHYQPDVVVLYLSKEMVEFHHKDNRYVLSLELLGQKLNHKFEIHIIEKENLVNVQNYDYFYQEFSQEIKKLTKQMQDGDELYLNMASGTPAMKSALNIITTLAEFKFHAIRVDSPKGASNSEHEERKDYDPLTTWELNDDNLEEAPNRCTEVRCMNLLTMFKLDIIKKHVMAYDYYAALLVAGDMDKEDLSDHARTLLEVAAERLKLNRSRVDVLLQKYPEKIYPVQDKQRIFEYALSLEIKLYKQEYADFVRAITPLSLDLLIMIMEKYCKIKIDDYTYVDRDVRKWDERKLRNTEILTTLILKYSPKQFHYGVVYSNALGAIIDAYCSDATLKMKVNELVKVEGSVRNIAAHDIVSVTDEWIYKRSGKRAEQIKSCIRYLVGLAGVSAGKEAWNSYDRMNERILQVLEE